MYLPNLLILLTITDSYLSDSPVLPLFACYLGVIPEGSSFIQRGSYLLHEGSYPHYEGSYPLYEGSLLCHVGKFSLTLPC